MKEGHREAFNKIYEIYWLKLYRAAFNRLRSEEDAKDLVQDLFASLWLKRGSLVINTSLSSYLFTGVKYRVINHIESNITKRNYLKSLREVALDIDNTTPEMITRMDLERYIDSGINVLSPKVKVIFELSRKEQLSIAEIAQKLNISSQTVKNQLGKAVKTLRVHLRDISVIFVFFSSFYICLYSFQVFFA